MGIGTFSAIINAIPFVGNIFAINTLFIAGMCFTKDYCFKFISEYKYAIRIIAVGKILISGAMIAYAFKDGDLYSKSPEHKCFENDLEISCLDSSKVSNVMLGELLILDGMIDFIGKASMGDFISSCYS